jgi:hypothetical protein
MAIRDKMAANAAPFLQPGETIQAVFPGQTTSAYMAVISYWIIILSDSYRAIVVTDRRILVCQAGRTNQTKIKGVIRELPRSTRIGPPSGLWYKADALGEKIYFHKRFHSDISRADSAIAAV